MTSQLLKTFLVAVIAVLLTLLMLARVLNGDFSPLVITVILGLFIVLTLHGSFGLCLALASTYPLLVSLPFGRGIPAPALALLICGIACAIRKAMPSAKEPEPLKAYDIYVMIFYAYLFARYAVNPVKPGYALGMGQDMTGFRSWVDHFIGGATMVLAGFLLNSRARMDSFFKTYLYSSCGFAFILMVIMFIPSTRLTAWLDDSGMYMAYFNNGWRRFVGLPSLGLVMVAGGLLPVLFSVRTSARIIMLGFGFLAVVVGGNKSSFIALLTLLAIFLIIKRKYLLLWGMVAIVLVSVATVKVLNDNQVIASDNPFVRVFGVFNQEIDEEAGSVSTMEWRLLRWKRAWIDIQEHPFVGVGYSGIQGYFALLSDFRVNSAELDMDRDLASGSTHNGYLSAARACGIPVTLLFIFFFTRQIVRHFRAAQMARGRDVKNFELHLFLFSYLLIVAQTITISGEIRQPHIWMFLAVSFLVFKLETVERKKKIDGGLVNAMPTM